MSTLSKLSMMEVKLFFRDRTAVFFTFLFPVLIVWLFGAMFGGQKMGGMTFGDLYIPAWISVNIMTIAFFGLGTVLANYREKGILRRYQATTLRPWMILTAHTAHGTIIFIISAIILLSFGFMKFDLHAPAYLWSTVLGFLLSIICFFPMALLLISIAKTTRAAASISSLAMNVMIFLSGATFPVEMMPTFFQYIAKVLPLYYVIQLTRATWNSSPIWENGLEVTVLAVIAVVSIIVSSKYFRWDSV